MVEQESSSSEQKESNAEIIETELLRWEAYRKMNKELASIKDRLLKKDAGADQDLRALVLSASMDLQVMISGRDSDELAANLGAEIRKAAEKSERKIALARGISYTPDTPQ